MAIYLMVAGKNGVAALELQRDLEITYKSAWHMVHRIRAAMSNINGGGKMRGIIVADEAFIGGNPQKANTKRRKTLEANHSDKTPVLTIVDARTGEIRSQVVANVQSNTLGPIINANVDRLGSILYTDSGTQYVAIGRRFVNHYTVNHTEGEYVNKTNGASTNIVESHFSQLKRSIDGTHHGVSPEHLNRYVREFDFCYSTRKMVDGERGMQLMRQTEGVRVTYRSLIAEGPFASGKRRIPPGRPGPRTTGASSPHPV